MNKDAFIAGFGQSLTKSGGVTEWLRENLQQPLGQGVLDGHYKGLGTYNAETGGVEPNNLNILRAIGGRDMVPAAPAPEGSNIFQRVSYGLGKRPLGKRLGLWAGGETDASVASKIQETSQGVFSMGDKGVQVNRENIPGLMINKARTWLTNPANANTIKGVGFGAAALGLGAMAFRKAKPKPTPQVAAPAGQVAAPFTQPPGQRGNYFQKYQG